MSRASKVTFGLTSVACVGTIAAVHYIQNMEREALRQGPVKDAARVAAKRDPAKERKLMLNQQEHEEQVRRREEFEKVQRVGAEVSTGEK